MRVVHFAKAFACSLLYLCSTLSATPMSWSTPEVIDNTMSKVNQDTAMCYNSETNQIFATWADSNNHDYPTYSIASYVGGQWSWSAPAVLYNASLSAAIGDVYSCYSSATNQIIATWADSHNSNYPTYSTASYAHGTWTWSNPTPITMERVHIDVFVSYNAETNQIFATWGDSSRNPIYSIASYEGDSWTWNTNSLPSSFGVWNHLFTCYASKTNQMIATWDELDTPYFPIYSIASYNGGNWTWTTPAIIDNTTSTVYDDVTISYNATANQVIAAWGDNNNNSVPTYSIGSYSNSTWVWSTPTVIDNTLSQVGDNLFTCFNSVNNQMFATWGDTNNNYYPTYAIASYTQGTWVWSAPTVLDNYLNPVKNNISLCYDNVTNQVFASWGDGNTSAPTVAFYTGAFILYDLKRFRPIYERQLEETKEALRNANL